MAAGKLFETIKRIGRIQNESLEHKDASLEATKHIPNQHTDDSESLLNSECEVVDDALAQIANEDVLSGIINDTIDPFGVFKKK